MTREEKQKAIGALKISSPVMAMTNKEFNDYILTINQVMDWLEQEPCEDCISREKAKQFLYERLDRLNDNELYDIFSRIIDDMYNELPSVTPQEPQTFKWCTDCKEYDQEKHCCHRWSKAIRATVEEMKQGYIEREVLDKLDEIITDALDKSTDQKESQTLRWVLDKISEVT